MEQIKIGKYISDKRRNKQLTQENLAEKLGVSKNAVSKWERGLNLPDAALMPELCKILGITLNEFFSGEDIMSEDYQEKADANLLDALENSTFTLQEKMRFYRKKWRKENIVSFITSFILWFAVILVLKFQGVDVFWLGAIAGILCECFYEIFNRRMNRYIEMHIFQNNFH